MRNLAAFLAILLGGCTTSETEIGNPGRHVSLEVEQGSAPAAALLSNPGLQFFDARVVVERFEFDEPNQDCAAILNDPSAPDPDEPGDVDLQFPGPFVLDLLHTVVVPETGSLNIPEANYCEIDVTLGPYPADRELSGDLGGKTLLVRGSRVDGVPFTVSASFTEEYEVGSPGVGIPMGADGFDGIFMVFFLESWFQGVDLDSADVRNGLILIDESHNPDLLATIVENVQTSSRIFGDADANGVLVNSEQEPDDILASGHLTP